MPVRTLFRSLVFRIGLAVLVVQALVLALVGGIALDRLTEEMDLRARDRITLPGTLMERGELSYEAVADRATLTHLIGQELEEGMVVGANWNVFHALNPDHLGRDIRQLPGIDPAWFSGNARQPSIIEVDEGDRGALLCVTPLFMRGAEVPTLFAYVKVNTGALAAQKAALRDTVAGVALLCALLTSAIIVLLFRVTVLRRIGGLTAFVGRIAKGDELAPLPVRPDELGVLEAGVNRMAGDLAQRAGQRARAEAELRESEARFRDFAAASSDWYWELDADLRYVALSDRFFELVRPALSPIGRPADELGVEAAWQGGWRAFMDRLERREPVAEFDVTWTDTRGQSYYARLSGLPVRDPEGRFTGYRGTGRDITLHRAARRILEKRVEERTAALTRANTELQETLDSLNRAQTELVRSEKLASLGALVAGVAHEINTPVGVAVTAASHLAERTRDLRGRVELGGLRKTELAAYLDVADESARLLLQNMERAAALIQSFKQVAADRSSERLRAFDLRSYLEDIVASLSPALRRQQHRIELDCPPGLEMVGYPGLLSQVVTNLIMNSLTHAFAEGDVGTLRIGAALSGSGLVELTYRDDGRGIAPEHLPRIFDPFFTTRREAGATGLGLNIVHSIVTGPMKGQLSAASTPGQGVTFTLRLPRVLQESAQAAE
ncbi:ATP-binding protein [Azospirillum sp. sgz302134]